MTDGSETELSMVERVARQLEPQAWAALGIGDTLAYSNRRTSSLRKARKAIGAMREPTKLMLMASGIHGTTNKSKYQAMIDEALKEPA